jgi:aminoglycoside 3-N-acetyltransferase
MTPAGRRWVTYTDVTLDQSDFAELGHDFETRSGLVRRGMVGAAASRLFPLREAVAFARDWFWAHRPRHR